jgi:hypothetical protein
MKKLTTIYLLLLLLIAMASPTLAHVPFIEHCDFTERKPFKIYGSVANSKAVYAWFHTGDDIDVYRFKVTEPVRVFVSAVVPICQGYEDLLPWFAVVGPGLPEPDEVLPFELPEGYGAVVLENLEPGEPRETFCEPFGGKHYYAGPLFDQKVSEPGTWYIYYWDPYEMGGDYVASIGLKEEPNLIGQIISMIYTPLIKINFELHTQCPQDDLPECPPVETSDAQTNYEDK